MGVVYHVSPVSGLTLLEPRVSTHGKAFVYAIENPVTALLFGVHQDDFDFCISTDAAGCPELFECYPGAFARIYTGRACSMYTLDAAGFLRGQTGWDAELVCARSVAVLAETVVPDLYDRLLEEEAHGNLTVHRWEGSAAYKKRISAHIVDRLIRFHALEYFETQDERGQKYYKKIIEALRSVMDGHLL